MTSEIFKSPVWAWRIKFSKYKPSMNQEFLIEGVTIGLVYSSRAPVNSYPHVSFIMMTCGDNTFWAAGEFFTAVLWVATGPVWRQGWVALSELYICAKHRTASQCCEHGCRILLHNVAPHIHAVLELGYMALLHYVKRKKGKAMLVLFIALIKSRLMTLMHVSLAPCIIYGTM